MKRTILKNVTPFMQLGFLSLVVLLSACKKDSNEVIVQTPEGVQVRIPFVFDQNAVFVEEGRAQKKSLDDMDLLGIAIESSLAGQDTYDLYANGLFTDIPDSLELTLTPGNDYKIFAFFYENTMDSVYSTTTYTLGFAKAQLNQMLYGRNATTGFHISEANAHNAVFCRTVPHGNSELWSTQHPVINHYATSLDFQFETEFIDTLKFRQHNTRFEVSVRNVNDASRIVVGLGDFVTFPIASDTTFTLDMKQIANPLTDLENGIIVSVDHDYFSNQTNFIQSLHESPQRLNRLEIIRVEITAPDPDTNPAGNGSEFVLIEEQPVGEDKIRDGG